MEIKVEGREMLEVRMAEEATLFDQIVVVGYGTQKKSDLTGAVSSVKGEDIARWEQLMWRMPCREKYLVCM